MYFLYLAYRGRDWKPDEACVVVCSLYDDLESGDIVHPAGTEDFGGATIIGGISADAVKQAWKRGYRDIYSNLPNTQIAALMED